MAGPTFLELLDKHFNKEELEELCNTLSVDYDNLGGEGKRAKARELIAYCGRRGKAPQLRAACAAARPYVAWPAADADEGQTPKALIDLSEVNVVARPVMPLPEAKTDSRPVVPLPEAEHDARPVVALPHAAPTPIARKPQTPTASPRRGSPFVVGRPLRPNEPIFGRDVVFEVIRSEVERLSSVNIVGERRMGKSSVISHLLENPTCVPLRSREGEPLVLARLDLQRHVTTPGQFYSRASRALLNVHLLEPETEELRRRLGGKPEADYDEFELVLYVLTTMLDLRPVLVIDEFEQLLKKEDDGGPSFPAGFFDGLRALLTADRLALVVASRRPLAEYFADPARAGTLTSTFPNYLSPVTLPALGRADADALLLQPSDHPLTNAQVAQAWKWCGGHPCHLQAAGAAWYEANRDGRDGASARQRFEELKGQACFVANATPQRDSSASPPRDNPLIAVLKAIFWYGPVRVGRVVQWSGGRVDSMVAWGIGMVLILIVVLVVLDIATGADLLAFLKRIMGVQ